MKSKIVLKKANAQATVETKYTLCTIFSLKSDVVDSKLSKNLLKREDFACLLGKLMRQIVVNAAHWTYQMVKINKK